jgi:SAM-dependent methyltransferase
MARSRSPTRTPGGPTRRRGDQARGDQTRGGATSPAGAKRRVQATRAPAANAWLVRTAPGLARTAQAELRHRKVIRHTDRVDLLWQRNHDLLFLPSLRADPAAADPRTAEELHRCLIYGRYKISEQQLDRLARQLLDRGGRWRIVATAEGTHFNRHDLQRFLGRALQARGVKVDDGATPTLFAFCVDQAYYVSVPERRAADMPGRAARSREREASLPPSIAGALAFLGRPEPGDTVLDPVMGSGTLLAEAHALAPDAALLGRDIDPKAVSAARGNLDGVPADLAPGDARELDLADASVSLILANLPFGKQYGEVAENPDLYRAMLREWRRVARPTGWRAVVLAADPDLVADTAKEAGLRVDRRVDIRVRGEPATILLLSRA